MSQVRASSSALVGIRSLGRHPSRNPPSKCPARSPVDEVRKRHLLVSVHLSWRALHWMANARPSSVPSNPVSLSASRANLRGVASGETPVASLVAPHPFEPLVDETQFFLDLVQFGGYIVQMCALIVTLRPPRDSPVTVIELDVVLVRELG